jgi:N12 class adenine-specific DNA methylase
MVGLAVSLPEKWKQFLEHLADDHEIDINTVVSELCEWAFSDPEDKEQFRIWLDEAYPPEGEAEDKARATGEEAAEEEEENEEESEEESHEHRD